MTEQLNASFSNVRISSSVPLSNEEFSGGQADSAAFQSAFNRQKALLSNQGEGAVGAPGATGSNLTGQGSSNNPIQQGLDWMIQTSSEISQNSARIKNDLTGTGNTKAPFELTEVVLDMNHQSLETQLMAKVVSKCTSAIDQLTKMQ